MIAANTPILGHRENIHALFGSKTPRLRKRDTIVARSDCALFSIEEYREIVKYTARFAEDETGGTSQSYFFLKSNILEIKFRRGATNRARARAGPVARSTPMPERTYARYICTRERTRGAHAHAPQSRTLPGVWP